MSSSVVKSAGLANMSPPVVTFAILNVGSLVSPCSWDALGGAGAGEIFGKDALSELSKSAKEAGDQDGLSGKIDRVTVDKGKLDFDLVLFARARFTQGVSCWRPTRLRGRCALVVTCAFVDAILLLQWWNQMVSNMKLVLSRREMTQPSLPGPNAQKKRMSNTCARFVGTHRGVLNLHTETF